MVLFFFLVGAMFATLSWIEFFFVQRSFKYELI